MAASEFDEASREVPFEEVPFEELPYEDLPLAELGIEEFESRLRAANGNGPTDPEPTVDVVSVHCSW